MRLYALISGDNVVSGIVQLEDESKLECLTGIYAQVVDITNAQPMAQLGWSFDGQSVVGTSQSMKITKLAMNQRFTVTEMLGLLTYVNTNPTSIVALLLQRLQIAQFVDLSRSDTQAGVGVLVQLGLLTSERANVILTTAPTLLEVYQG